MSTEKKVIGVRPDEELIAILEAIRAGRSIKYQQIIRDAVGFYYRNKYQKQPAIL
jgi:hypothetical protein